MNSLICNFIDDYHTENEDFYYDYAICNSVDDYPMENKNFDNGFAIQVLFPGGVTHVPFNICVIDDVIIENSEKFSISIDSLSLPYGICLGDITRADIIILDDDGK